MEEYEDYLSAGEISELQTLLERPNAIEALRKVLLRVVYNSGTLRPGKKAEAAVNWAWGLVGSTTFQQGVVTDRAIAKDLRSKWLATTLVETGFRELEKFKKVVVEEKNKINKAR